MPTDMKEWTINGLLPDLNNQIEREIIEGIRLMLENGYDEFDIMKMNIQQVLDKYDELKDKI